MSSCDQELCPNWAGDDCVCSVLGIDRSDERCMGEVGDLLRYRCGLPALHYGPCKARSEEEAHDEATTAAFLARYPTPVAVSFTEKPGEPT